MKKFLKNLSKYSIVIDLIAVVIGGIMIYSLKLETDSLRLSQRQYLNSLKPTWEYKLKFAQNNYDITSISFKTSSESINLQNLEVYFPKDFPTSQTSIKTYVKEWKCYGLNKKLEKVVENSYHLQEGDEPALRFEECYPIAIKFNYIQYGEVKTNLAIYNINFTVFNKGKIKIRALEFMESRIFREELISNYLNKLNCLTCLKNLDCVELTEWEIYKSNDERLLPVIENIDYALSLQTQNRLTLNEKGDTIKNENITAPLFIMDQEAYKQYFTNLSQIDNLKIEGLDISEFISPIKLFLQRTGPCKPQDFKCLKRNKWDTEEVQYEWKILNVSAMLEIIRWHKSEEIKNEKAS